MYSKFKEVPMLALRLPADMEKRLDALAKRTGRTKSFYARRAIMEFIEDLEDVLDAEEVLAASDGKYVTLEEIEARLAKDLATEAKAKAMKATRPRKQASANPRKAA
jgi:RHH-type transcriptional regulator, rel operon repressor / antitoxin RelB